MTEAALDKTLTINEIIKFGDEIIEFETVLNFMFTLKRTSIPLHEIEKSGTYFY